ncbi:hypothetical protein EGW08_017304 [Elysia chlorotica]|uniref:Uncharacterized protein n=1 Tax=Elysia chlorotica TaxID=188477 RepID=A0A433T054_ELYCH|nr:hypothetical protein EGW08_017304 [Elysia chlorotica]
MYIDLADPLPKSYAPKKGIICTSGRTQADFDRNGTGTGLWIQNGSTPDQVTQVPYYQNDLSGTNWIEGRCFNSMVFLLYNGGRLNAFGWALLADLPAPFYEHPTRQSVPAFMEVIPDCLRNLTGRMSTMHIYMTWTPALNFC